MVGEKGKTNHTDGCPAKDEMDFVVRWHIGFLSSLFHIFHDFMKQGAKEKQREGGVDMGRGMKQRLEVIYPVIVNSLQVNQTIFQYELKLIDKTLHLGWDPAQCNPL